MTATGQVPYVVEIGTRIEAGLDAVALLGGKGAGLAEMSRDLGLPVPPGFTITTEAYRRYAAEGWFPALDDAIAQHLEQLATRLGRRFGDPRAPLLVSVRSGAPVSMPGMLDTLLNVGMTPEIRAHLAAESGSERFAADTWLRLCCMYAETVIGVGTAAVDAAAAAEGDGAAARLAAAERVRELAAVAVPGGIPADPAAQLRGAVEAVFRSWHSERARVFRKHEGIAEDLGTAVTVQAMVFGNLDKRSGTGVVFTRDPAGGKPGPYGDYLPRAQGEDVVAGDHRVHGFDLLRTELPAVYDALLLALDRLERHYRDMCDVEFTVSRGELYVLQTRIGRRSPLAAVRIAVAMAEEPDFPLTRAEAVSRIDPSILHQLAAIGRVDPRARPLARGLPASPGVGVGRLCCDPDRAAELAERGEAVVLAREETSPADVHGMVGAAGLVTTRGGVASHAAVVARGWAIPAVTSLAGELRDGGLAAGGRLLAEGEIVTVDGAAGALYEGDRREAGSADVPEIRALREWAAELGLEPGSALVTRVPPIESAKPITELQVARTVQLKGLCTAEHAARVLGTQAPDVEQIVAAHAEIFESTPRGLFLSPAGRDWVAEQIDAERRALDGGLVEAAYSQFVELNRRFKRLVSEWQMSSSNGEAETAWPAVIEELARIHEQLEPLLRRVAEPPRLSNYQRRFDAAFEALLAGDRTMLAAPLKESYHTVWFEYHEELIALSGRDRAVEEAEESEA